MVDYNAYWDALAGTVAPIEDVSDSVLENSDDLGMFVIAFFFLVVIICVIALVVFQPWRK